MPTKQPNFLRTVLILLVTGYVWYLLNIERGSVPAIQASPWFRGATPLSIWILALSGSAVQIYITKEWEVDASLFNRSRLFRWGSAAILFLWDIALPAWGLLLSAGITVTFPTFAVAVVFELVGSWWAQQAAVGALEDVMRVLFRRPAATMPRLTLAPKTDKVKGRGILTGSAKK